MKDWNELKIILDEQKISDGDRGIVKDFFSQFSFPKRQQLLGVFIGFPEKISVFIDLIKMKKGLAENYDSLLAKKVLNLENSIMAGLIQEINTD